jgi:DNA-binding NtrC family response regulator
MAASYLWLSPVMASSGAVRQEIPVSLQFVSKLFHELREVAPSQVARDEKFEAELRSLMTRAKSLQSEFHRAEQGGMRATDKRKRLENEGRRLIEEALKKTEGYLESVLLNLKSHRSSLAKKLLPPRK